MPGIEILFLGGFLFHKVSLERSSGVVAFRELARSGPIPLGGAVLTTAGRLNYKGIIHVAGISMWWRSSEQSVRDSVASALALSKEHKFKSLALPLIGAGTGGGSEDEVLRFIKDELEKIEFDGEVVIVRFKKAK